MASQVGQGQIQVGTKIEFSAKGKAAGKYTVVGNDASPEGPVLTLISDDGKQVVVRADNPNQLGDTYKVTSGAHAPPSPKTKNIRNKPAPNHVDIGEGATAVIQESADLARAKAKSAKREFPVEAGSASVNRELVDSTMSARYPDYFMNAAPSKINFDKITYHPRKPDQSLSNFAAEAVGAPAETKLSILSEKGGMRTVYNHPSDPGKVGKVFDTDKVKFNNRLEDHFSAQDLKALQPAEKEAAIRALSESMIADLVQRELAVYNYMKKIEEGYIAAGKVPPFRVAKITSTPKQLSKGIIVQEKINASRTLFDDWARSLRENMPEHIDKFLTEVNRHQATVHDAVAQMPSHLKLRVDHTMQHLDGGEFYDLEKIGNDWGADLGNVAVVNDPKFGGKPIPVFYDW